MRKHLAAVRRRSTGSKPLASPRGARRTGERAPCAQKKSFSVELMTLISVRIPADCASLFV
jgi:hypothetical protein